MSPISPETIQKRPGVRVVTDGSVYGHVNHGTLKSKTRIIEQDEDISPLSSVPPSSTEIPIDKTTSGWGPGSGMVSPVSINATNNPSVYLGRSRAVLLAPLRVRELGSPATGLAKDRKSNGSDIRSPLARNPYDPTLLKGRPKRSNSKTAVGKPRTRSNSTPYTNTPSPYQTRSPASGRHSSPYDTASTGSERSPTLIRHISTPYDNMIFNIDSPSSERSPFVSRNSKASISPFSSNNSPKGLNPGVAVEFTEMV